MCCSVPLRVALVSAALLTAQVVQATPVAPGALPAHLWLFDENSPTATPDEYGGLDLYGSQVGSAPSSSRKPLLVQTGSVIRSAGTSTSTAAVASGTPLSYSGNQSVLVDWPGDGNTYPNATGTTPRTGVGALQSPTPPSISIGTSGAISFWYNPLRHDGSGTEQYLISLRNTANSARISIQTGGGSPGMFEARNASTTVAAGTADYGFSYGGAANSMPGTNWYQLTYSWSPGNSIQVFMNGALLTTGFGDMEAFTANRIQIGSYYTSTAHAPGLYDEVAIWDTPLTLENAQWLYANSLNGFSLVPEPATAGMFLAGMIGLAIFRRKRKSA
jgi:hypothetical protein